MQSFVLRDAFALKRQRELCHPKCARKVSGLLRDGPQAPVVQRVDNTIQWITQKILVGFICWIPLSEL